MQIQRIYQLLRGCDQITFVGPCRECENGTKVVITKNEPRGVDIQGGCLVEPKSQNTQSLGVYVVCQKCMDMFDASR